MTKKKDTENLKILGDGKVYKIQKVRQRKIHSCVPCHSKKIKCLREHPMCSNCSKTGLDCKYFMNERVSRGKKKDDETGELSGDVSAAKLKDDANSLNSPPSEGSNSMLSPSNSPSPDLPLSKMLSPASTPEMELDEYEALPVVAQQISIDNSDYNYINSLNSVDDITNKNFKQCFNQLVLPNTTIPSNILISYLPTRERSYDLLNRYINSVQILLPIVDINEFITRHEVYWNSTTVDIDSNFEFYLLLFPILYGSCVSEFEEYDNLLLYDEIDRFYKGFKLMNQIFNFPNSNSTNLLIANIIMQSTSFNPSPLEMSMIVRYSQKLGFHRDPAMFHKFSDSKIVQIRRLIWWQVFSLDSLTSLNFCLTPIIKLDEFDTSLPVEFTNNQLNYSIVCLNANFRYSLILNEIVKQLNGLNVNLSLQDMNLIKSKIVDLHISIHSSNLNVVNNLAMNPPTNVKQLNFIQFVRNYIGSFTDRALLLFQKKILMSVKNASIKTENIESNLILNLLDNEILYKNFNKYENFQYDNLSSNLISSILHNLNDFINYNDFIKFGKFNWYIKRTIPVDSIIFLFMIISIKFKKNSINLEELFTFVNLINTSLFILNKNWFKTEKYKRMLSLVNLSWEFLLKNYKINQLLAANNYVIDKPTNNIHNNNYVVPKPSLTSQSDYGMMKLSQFQKSSGLIPSFDEGDNNNENNENRTSLSSKSGQASYLNNFSSIIDSELKSILNFDGISDDLVFPDKTKSNVITPNVSSPHHLSNLKDKIYYNLDNNFVDENDYCEIFCHLERILKNLMNYVDDEK